MRLSAVLALSIIVGLAACQGSSGAAFIGRRALDTCDGEIPVCNTTAGCTLRDEDRYLEGEFPGQRSFIVPTTGEATIRIEILWVSQLGPGADTEIIWFEPACVDSFRYESQGANVFLESNPQGIFVQQQKVARAGEHLVEVRSDATASYLLRTSVLSDAEVAEEQTPGLSLLTSALDG
jgi:hypothetical protein